MCKCGNRCGHTCDADKPKFDPSKPVQTEEGRAARVICTDAVDDEGEKYGLALYKQNDGSESSCAFNLQTGKTLYGADSLVNIPEEMYVLCRTDLPEGPHIFNKSDARSFKRKEVIYNSKEGAVRQAGSFGPAIAFKVYRLVEVLSDV